MSPVAQDITRRLDRLPFGSFHATIALVVLTGLAFDHMDQVVLSFAIPRYRVEWGIGEGLASVNPTTGLAGTFLGALFWGMLADRIGRKVTLMITLAVFSVAMGMNGFSWGFWQLVLTCIAMGTGVGGTIPMAFTLLAEYMPARQRGMTMVVVGILSLVLGYLIASGSALILGDRFGWRSLFLVGTAPLAVIPLIARQVPESPRHLLATGRVDEALRIVERLEARAGLTDEAETLPPIASDLGHGGEGLLSFRGLRRLWSRPYLGRTITLWTYAYAFGFFTFGFLTWLPTVLGRAGFTDGRIELYTTIMDLFALPVTALTAYLFFRWSTKGTLVLYPALAGAAMLAFSALVRTDALAVSSLLPVGGAVFAFGTILLGVFGPYCSEVYPTEIRGTGTGWATGVSRLGALSAIPVGGVLLSSGAPLFVQQLIFGVPLLLAALIMAVGGIETRGRSLEEIATAASADPARRPSRPTAEAREDYSQPSRE